MAEALDPKEIVKFREMVTINTIRVDTMYQLQIQKGYFTEVSALPGLKKPQAAGRISDLKAIWHSLSSDPVPFVSVSRKMKMIIQ